jgi:hypothetical protein
MGRCKMKYTIISALAALVLCSLALNSFAKKDTVELDEARIIFEVNNTDGDIGIQLILDSDPFDSIKGFNPDGQLFFDMQGKNSLKDLGLTENFFESNEPLFRGPEAEITIEEILDMFPEGDYELKGMTVDGMKLEGTATLSHVLPCGPVITSPVGNPDPDNTVIAWNDVITEIDHETGECVSSGDIDIIAYEVIVENDDVQQIVFDVLLPGSANSIMVSPEFLDFDTEYDVEVIAIQSNDGEYGNQTITEDDFTTSEAP